MGFAMTKKDFAGIALMLAALCAMGGLFYAKQLLSREKHDADTLCLMADYGGVTAATVILIDKSDPYTQLEAEAIRQLIYKARDNLAVGAKLKIAVIEKAPSANATQIRVLRGICNPGSGSTANLLTENEKMKEQLYRNAFLEPLNQNLKDLLVPGTSPTSPIAEALSIVIAEDGDVARVEKGRLLLVTDLFEHTAKGSAYKGNLTSQVLIDQIPDTVRSWLDGAQVEIKLIRRHDDLERQAATRKLWEQFFRRFNAQVSIEEL
jgi:hypothetical protein